MKIVVAAKGPYLQSQVASKLGEARFFVCKKSGNDKLKSHVNPGRGAGQGAVVKSLEELALLKAQVLVTGFCPPWVEERLRKMDIRVVNGFKGTVRDALTKAEKLAGSAARGNEPVEMSWFKAFAMAGRQLQAMLPVFVGIILLVGLLREIATPRTLQLLFTGDFVSDAIWGALVGSVITGQPLNSYVIADQLLEQNVSLVGATALLAAWVNVGVAQLPLEVKALGLKFALARNSLGFLFSLVMAWSMGALHLFWPWGMEAL